MREALFIKKNKDRWLRTQHQPSVDPDEMAADFTRLLDDLAYAKTFYPAGKVTGYINAQASRIYLDIYRNRKEESNRLITFWKYELPLVIRKHHGTIFFAFISFCIFFIIGYFTSARDEGLARSVMGDDYINMTQENIENGNPFGVYESGNPVLSWLGIMINNIKVAVRDFVSGIFCGIPTFLSLGKFGIMVGTFDQFMASKGLGTDFWLVVFVHGVLEISAFIIVCAAGFVLGKSYLFPGTIRRIDSFKKGAKEGVKILIGLIPVFALAAFFEGLFTRLYNDISLLPTDIMALCDLFVSWYIII
ncbi:MAG: stage II sporulation protein M, partial [Chitinophagaceae bacterium]